MSESAKRRTQTALLADLGSGVSLVRKYALRDLAGIGDAKAHRALLQMLEDTKLTGELRQLARESLNAIEARLGLGSEVEVPTPSGRFDKPLISMLAPPPPLEAPPPMLDPATANEEPMVVVVGDSSAAEALVARARLLEAALKGVEKLVEPRDYGYRIQISLMGGRHQYVRLSFESQETETLIVAYTVCGPASAEHYAWALELNRRLERGRLALGHDVDDQPCFLFMDAISESRASAEELRRVILTVAEKGDSIEQLLTDKDVY